jgi:hypothetical protein
VSRTVILFTVAKWTGTFVLVVRPCSLCLKYIVFIFGSGLTSPHCSRARTLRKKVMVVSRNYEGSEKAGKEHVESPCPTKERRTRLSIDNALPGTNMNDTNRKNHVNGH